MNKLCTACLILAYCLLATPAKAQNTFGEDRNWSPLFSAPSPLLHPRSLQASENLLFVSGSIIPPDSLEIISGTLYRGLDDADVRYLDIEGWESASYVVGESRLFAWIGEYTGALVEINLDAGTTESIRPPLGIQPRFKVHNDQLYTLSFSDSVRVFRWDEAEWQSLGPAIPDINRGVFDWHVGEDGVYVAYGSSSVCNEVNCQGSVSRLADGAWTRIGLLTGKVNQMITGITQDSENRVVVVGDFRQIDGVAVERVARWDGTGWTDLNTGLPEDMTALFGLATMSDRVYVSSAEGHIIEWDGARWNSLGNRADDAVYELVIRGDRLFASGEFTTVDDVVVHQVAEWRAATRTWVPVFEGAGGGVDGQVRTIAVTPDGILYAGGILDAAGQASAGYVARWNGNTWSPADTGLDAAVDVLIEHDGIVYAGTGTGLAVYEENQDIWTYLSNPDAGVPLVSVYDVVIFRGEPYVLGQNGETFDRGLFRWNGNTWEEAADFRIQGQRAWLVSLATDGEDVLYVAGFFEHVNEVDALDVAAWDGETWTGVGDGEFVEITTTAVGDGLLYVGGNAEPEAGRGPFLRVWNAETEAWSDIPAPDVEHDACEVAVDALLPLSDGVYAGLGLRCVVPLKRMPDWSPFLRWNGEIWEIPGSGIANGGVSDIAVNDSDIYISGSFNGAGGRSSLSIAHWNETIVLTSTDRPEGPTRAGLQQNYPNPFSGQTTISFTLEAPSSDVQLEVYDVLGRRVTQLHTGSAGSGAHQVTFDASAFAAGIYMYRLSIEDKVYTRKMIVL